MRETKATRADSQRTAHHVDVCLAKPQRERQQKQPQAHSTTNEQRDRPCKPGVGITNETAPEDPGPEKQNSEQRKRSCHSPVPRGAKVKLDAALARSPARDLSVLGLGSSQMTRLARISAFHRDVRVAGRGLENRHPETRVEIEARQYGVSRQTPENFVV